MACSKPIAASVGEAKMVITIGCMAKGRSHVDNSVSAASRSNSSVNFEDDGALLLALFGSPVVQYAGSPLPTAAWLACVASHHCSS